MSRRAYLDLALIAIVWAVLCLVWAVSTCHGQDQFRGLAIGGWRSSTPTAESVWEWSPAAAHHQAVVRVVCSECGAGGSGVYVAHGETMGVLTARHVADSATATCTFSDGTTETGQVTYDKYGHDVALVFVTHPTIQPLTVSDTAPATGSRVEFVSYGGPDKRLRHFWGAIESDGKYNAPVVYGDSGCPIFDLHHRVVGIQESGRGKLHDDPEWPVFRRSGAVAHAALFAFCGRVAANCPRGGCCPDDRQPRGGGIGFGAGIEFYPPPRRKQPPVLPGPAPQPEQPEIPIPDEDPEPPEEDDGELTLLLTELTVNVNQLTVNVNKMANNLDDLTSRVEQLEMGFESEEFLARIASLVKVEPPAFPDYGPLTFQLLDRQGEVIQTYQAGIARFEGETVPFQLVPVKPRAK